MAAQCKTYSPLHLVLNQTLTVVVQYSTSTALYDDLLIEFMVTLLVCFNSTMAAYCPPRKQPDTNSCGTITPPMLRCVTIYLLTSWYVASLFQPIMAAYSLPSQSASYNAVWILWVLFNWVKHDKYPTAELINSFICAWHKVSF